MRRIPLSNGGCTLVSDEDYAYLSQWRWLEQTNRRSSYAVRKSGNRSIYMHRVILGAESGETVDHANHDGLDNRRENLRFASPSLNMVNFPRSPGINGPRGIERKRAGWRASLRLNRVRRYGPVRHNIIHAAFDYDLLALELHGPFAILNFPCLKGDA
jgi:hypothetical protein